MFPQYFIDKKVKNTIIERENKPVNFNKFFFITKVKSSLYIKKSKLKNIYKNVKGIVIRSSYKPKYSCFRIPIELSASEHAGYTKIQNTKYQFSCHKTE